MVVTKNLHKFYGKTVAINGLNFKLKPGTITGFLGPNGAGKSTTLKILTGFLLPDEGSITFDGQQMGKDTAAIQSRIGYLPEHNALYNNLRVDEYLRYTLSFYPDRPKLKYRETVIGETGLDDVMDKRIGTLSKGYRQRVGIARALLTDPKYIFLDEPTTGLDPNQKEEILKLIKTVSKNKVVLFSSHVLAEVEHIADELLVINQGEIAAQGKTKDLLAKGLGGEVRVQVKAPPKQFISQVKKQLGVSSIESLTSYSNATVNNSFSTYIITAKEAGNFNENLFNLVVTNKWQLRELTTVSQGLESLFKQLTAKQK